MATQETFALLKKETATGSTVRWPGGKGTYHIVSSDFNGATASLQRLGPDGSTWTAVGVDTTVTANALVNFELGESDLRVAITVAVPAAGVWAEAAGMKDA